MLLDSSPAAILPAHQAIYGTLPQWQAGVAGSPRPWKWSAQAGVIQPPQLASTVPWVVKEAIKGPRVAPAVTAALRIWRLRCLPGCQVVEAWTRTRPIRAGGDAEAVSPAAFHKLYSIVCWLAQCAASTVDSLHGIVCQ